MRTLFMYYLHVYARVCMEKEESETAGLKELLFANNNK